MLACSIAVGWKIRLKLFIFALGKPAIVSGVEVLVIGVNCIERVLIEIRRGMV